MQKCITIVMYLILFSTYDLTVYNFLPVFFQCQKNEHFRKHMLLLWQNNVPMCIEVLMSPECRTEPVRSSLAVTTMAEPGSLLLEQWTVAVLPASTSSGSLMTSLALLQAVRSYLHFSQVSCQNNHTFKLIVTLFLPNPALCLVLPEQRSQPLEHICTNHHPWRGVCFQVCQTSRVALLPCRRSWCWISSCRLCSFSPSYEGPAPGPLQQHPWPCWRGG